VRDRWSCAQVELAMILDGIAVSKLKRVLCYQRAVRRAQKKNTVQEKIETTHRIMAVCDLLFLKYFLLKIMNCVV